jgi:hypothetical protein
MRPGNPVLYGITLSLAQRQLDLPHSVTAPTDLTFELLKDIGW